MPEEAATTKSDPQISKGKLFIDRLNAYRNIILAVAALATSVAGWFKPTDTTATKQSFDWTTKKVEELSKNDVQMHDDIVAIRAYLEGMRAAQQPAAPMAAPMAAHEHTPHMADPVPVAPVATSEGRIAGAVRRPHRPPQGAMDAVDRIIQTPVDQLIQAPLPTIGPFAGELPTLKAHPHPMERPSFEDVLHPVQELDPAGLEPATTPL